MIDNADKDKKNRIYDINFSIKVFFTKIEDKEYVMKPKLLKQDKQRVGKKKWRTNQDSEE